MQAFTHMAVGAALGVAIAGRDSNSAWRRSRLALAALTAALSHPLLDDLARATYHPPSPQWGEPFWWVFHALTVVATLVVAWRFRRLWLLMAASLTPDLDWIVGRPLGLWEGGAAHALVRKIPGLASASGTLQTWVPDLRHMPSAALFEVLPVAALVLVLWRQAAPASGDPAPRPAHPVATPSPVIEQVAAEQELSSSGGG